MLIFNRQIEVLVDHLQFVYPHFFMEFKTYFNKDSEPNQAEIVLYNISRETEHQIKEGQSIILNAGYQGDKGTIFAGVVEAVETSWAGLDKVVRIECGDASDRWANTVVNKTFQAGTKASQMIKDLLQGFGLEVGQVTLTRDVIYPRGRTFSMPLRTALQQLAKETESTFHISNGSVVFRATQGGKETGFILRAESGLIDSPKKVTGRAGVDFSLSCFLNHRLQTDSIIQIESKLVNGIFQVVSGEHIGNQRDFITNVEVVAV